MKKAIAIASMLCMFFVGCGQINENFNISGNVVSEMQIDNKEHTITNTILSQIQIVDVVSETYAEDLSIDVSEKYLSRFENIYENVSPSNEIIMREPLYSIKMFDTEGNVTDVWIVDSYRTIETSNGNHISRDGEIDSLLNEIEKEYSIGYNLLERHPGSKYFSALTKTDKAYFKKFNTLYFEDTIEYGISSEILDRLKENWSNIVVSEESISDYSIMYTICFFNSDGNDLQIWHIDSNNKIYTSYGYELQGEFIANWISEVMTEALT